MNKKKLTKFVPRFIQKAVGENDIRIYYVSARGIDSPARVDFKTRELYLNCNVLRSLKTVLVQAIILHELGHIYSLPRQRAKSKGEFQASAWGIIKAVDMGMPKVAFQLQQSFRDWQLFKWDSEERVYLMAYRLAKKLRVI